MSPRSLALAFLALALPACKDLFGPDYSVRVDWIRAVVDSTSTLRITYVVRNVGQDSQLVGWCSGDFNPYLEKKRGSEWRSYAGGVCPANQYPYKWLAPHSALESSLAVQHVQSGEAMRIALNHGGPFSQPIPIP